jgi:hypothetical protein
MLHAMMRLRLLVGVGVASWLGCSDPARSTAQVYLTSSMDENTQCGAVGPLLALGTPSGLVRDGDMVNGARVEVTCQVRAIASGFDVILNAKQPGVGFVTVSGTFTETGTQSNVSATFSNTVGEKFSATNCTFQYLASPGIFPGRIWGHLDCAALVTAQSASVPQRSCVGIAEVRFENCVL